MAPLAVWILCSHISTVFFPEFFRTPFQFNGLVLGVAGTSVSSDVINHFFSFGYLHGTSDSFGSVSCYFKTREVYVCYDVCCD